MMVGCRRVISKTETGQMNIIRNQSEGTYTCKGGVSDENHTWLVLVTSILIRCVKGGGMMMKYLSYLSIHGLWMVPYFTSSKGRLNPYNNFIMMPLITILNMLCFEAIIASLKG